MCDGKKCPHCEQEGHKREEKAKRLIQLIMSIDNKTNLEEFTEIRLEMIRLINEMV